MHYPSDAATKLTNHQVKNPKRCPNQEPLALTPDVVPKGANMVHTTMNPTFIAATLSQN
jgi:hypothetical protein